MCKSANPTVEHLQPSPKKSRQRATKALGGWRGDGSAKDLIELLSLYKSHHFMASVLNGAQTLEIETFSVFQFFKVLSIVLSTSL